jgi:hypothetical protein
VWTVRLANLEVRAHYLDLALAQLLGNAPEAHRAAARLMAELADVVEQQKAVSSEDGVVPPRRRRRARPRKSGTKPLWLGLRVFAFGLIGSTAFLVTTWLTAFR